MRFKLLEPICLTEAREILMEQENVAIMAGGTDLLVKIKAGLIKPSIVPVSMSTSTFATWAEKQVSILFSATKLP
ncbi:hypothetical protein [Desulfosporosinus sp. BICA1-9]|uniref:hypothetical protein n=1 Tax=Desulfosporosinus sp. BICA1-9 TaxID=1531958 RepID=UPI00054B4BC5|nr:hypothetical protein [Desulfosporosinus sp. BICA1-9]KJS48641.1 MAG: hypothetical protein VR66_12865 [Peptococcaceae bacterium BRH_c23]KJS88922.1 MAG: hypothetical protein JL57_10075 [Desulfosporosinus sp. BICA1-9]HBW36040.1 hypothetical protein [Desulfosporosinus sp.]